MIMSAGDIVVCCCDDDDDDDDICCCGVGTTACKHWLFSSLNTDVDYYRGDHQLLQLRQLISHLHLPLNVACFCFMF